MKKCFKCLQDKELGMFYRHSRMADGHLNKCIECAKKDIHENRHGSCRNRVLAYDRRRYQEQPHRKEKSAEYVGIWRAKFPGREKAHRAVRDAVRKGTLIPLPCFVCGERAEAHHSDYDRPLDVVWLCPSHHKQAHSKNCVTF